MRPAKLCASLRDRVAAFAADRRANVAATFAIALLPILGLVGAAVDYSIAVNTRTKIVAALDTSVLLATSRTELNYTASTAQADALKIFNAQIGTFGITTKTASFTVTDAVNGRTAVGTATADVPTTFMKVMGFNKLTVSGNSTAKVGLPVYIDFYLLLDNTPSMGVAATTADIATMVNNTSDKCAFACHDTYTSSSQTKLQTNSYYDLAKKLGVTMRIDVVRQATQALMDKAAATAAVSNQFRMAISTMGYDCSTAGATSIQALTSNLTTAKASASAIDLMTIPYANYNNDQCTDFDDALSDMNNAIPTPGSGTSSSPQKYLFLVADGVADFYSNSCNKKTTAGTYKGRCQEPLDTSICTTMKNRGVKIAVLYTTYLQLPTNQWYMDWIDPFNKGPFSPSPNSEIAKNMEACASPGFYFEVGPDDGISEAMNALFQKAVSTAHLTN
jgi:Flp pilus assembly protein TadG